MVQGIDNLTVISGTITQRKRHPTLADYDIATMSLERTDPVEGKADLLVTHLGETIDVVVLRALLGDAGPGDHLHCRAKRTPEGAMCEKDPAPGAFFLNERE
jgi:hypothetical protein